MRCLECPVWYPITEYQGYCLYSDAATEANYVCKTMRNCKSKMVNGTPRIPENLDKTVVKKIVKILESNMIEVRR